MAVIPDKQRVAASDRENRPSAAEQPHRHNRQQRDEVLVSDGFELPDIAPPEYAPPAYGEHLDQMTFSQPGVEAGAEVTGDGRVNIHITTKNRRLADLLASTLDSQASVEGQPTLPPAYIPPSLGSQPGQTPPPKLNIVVQIVGSRGDVQPFVALGKVLKETYGHRVRIATHPTFQGFVEGNGLEFFSIGGDPAELMAFMVKHPGLMPGFDAVKSGEVSKRRKGIAEMLMGCWRSCIEAGDGLGPPPKPHAKDEPLDLSADVPGFHDKKPFVADAIIANPPSFAHIHVAEKLGIPLHMMFTMPWSPTKAFPHPLANIQSSNADDVMTNYLTYTLVEMMTWQGLGDVINRFRDKALDLAPLSLIWAPGLLTRLKIPYTYCWSPALIPKPNDWRNNVDIPGFFFLDLASSYTPEPDLAAFLEAGPPPVYIGFGSIVVDDPNAMTRMIFDAIHLAGVRALVSKGWGGLGADTVGLPEGVFMLGNVPHDWLFQHVSCVVHHGGAGTTAAGIKAGRPTVIVPFFGDQPFWGAMISRAGAGPDPVTHKDLTAEKLAEAIKFCLQTDTQERAQELGQKIREEKGTDVGGMSFHNHLNVDNLRCDIAPSRTAVWRVRRTKVKLSPVVAALLVDEGLLKYSDMKLYRPIEYNTEDQPPDPISACACSLVTDMSTIGMSIADMPRELFKSRQRAKDNVEAKSRSASTSSKPNNSAADDLSVAPPSSTDLSFVSTQTPTEGTTVTSQPNPTSSAEHDQALQQLRSDLLSPVDPPTPASGSSYLSPNRPGSSTSEPRPSSPRREVSPAGVSLEAAVGAGRNVGQIVSTGVKSPMNFCLGLAKGFRNVPRLYNDDTVRPVEKVTDFSSGLKVAGKEFGYGLFDGISGLVMQPLRGAEKDGASGLVKGFGKGIGGLITKPAAGFWGIPAYTMQGVHAGVTKIFAKSVQNYVIASRIAQGRADLTNATNEERADILLRWQNSKYDLKNFYQLKRKEKAAEKAPESSRPVEETETGFSRPTASWFQARQMSADERKKLKEQKAAWKKRIVETSIPHAGSSTSLPSDSTFNDAEFEQAIQASVRETSRGNAEEDAMVENAIRESVLAVREQGGLPEPIPETHGEKDVSIFNDEEYKITDEEYQTLIEQAIQQSLNNNLPHLRLPQEDGVMELDAPYGNRPTTDDAAHNLVADDNDEIYEDDLRRVIEESRSAPTQTQPTATDDGEFQRAIEASRADMEREKNERTEEDIVLEYVKKQSLAEEEFRRQASKGKEAGDQSADEEVDDDLRRALEESLKMSHGDNAGPSGSKD
ncbi:glucosyl/glucuronosyl transferase [Paramyrothecium foliicola]|nr:glucosyl/glucuronosyl transferase [Paramyrothecium foliicola]